jgi:Rrf2 family iron-sulfur cluster assembly transcriptional regulator
MIYSKSSEYAIRAAVHLAQLPDGHWAMAKDIARDEDIPVHFLAKILQNLARDGFLTSLKGPSGGFCLKKNPRTVRLLDIVEAVDGSAHLNRCIGGHDRCSDRTACPLHDSWMPVQSRIMEYLGRNTIGNLVKSLEGKQKAARRKRPVESGKSLRSSL